MIIDIAHFMQSWNDYLSYPVPDDQHQYMYHQTFQ